MRKTFYFGVAIPIIFLVFLALSIIIFPNYNPQANYLSDLGNGASAIFYNSGLILTGFLIIIFSISTRIGKIGSTIFALAGISLVGVGIFPSAQHDAHFIFSALFFILSAISMIVTGIHFRNISKRVSLASLFFGLLAVEFIILRSIPIIEHFAVFGIGFWIIAITVHFFRKSIKTSNHK